VPTGRGRGIDPGARKEGLSRSSVNYRAPDGRRGAGHPRAADRGRAAPGRCVPAPDRRGTDPGPGRGRPGGGAVAFEPDRGAGSGIPGLALPGSVAPPRLPTCSTSSAGSGRVRALCAVPTWSSSGRWPNASRRPPPCGPARNASGRLPNRRTTRSSPRALASVTPSSPSGEQSPPKRVNPGARQRHDAAKHRGTGKSVITAGGPGDLAGTKLDQQGGHRGNARGAVRRREDVAPWSPSPCSPGLPVPRLFIFDTAVLSTGRPSIIT
jgi:hypothetical protein